MRLASIGLLTAVRLLASMELLVAVKLLTAIWLLIGRLIPLPKLTLSVLPAREWRRGRF
jgi:hypothetical protein